MARLGRGHRPTSIVGDGRDDRHPFSSNSSPRSGFTGIVYGYACGGYWPIGRFSGLFSMDCNIRVRLPSFRVVALSRGGVSVVRDLPIIGRKWLYNGFVLGCYRVGGREI